VSELSTVWLSQEAFDKLLSELDQLKTTGRKEVSQRIADARAEGDLSENGGYHAAREEQGQMEGRILQLEQMLREAKIGEPTTTDAVSAGAQITVAYFGDLDDPETFVLGSREMLPMMAADAEITIYSPQSPLGAALMGASVGETVNYTAPNGKTIEVTVLDIEPFNR
jgi:transcription elongation factor GreA